MARTSQENRLHNLCVALRARGTCGGIIAESLAKSKPVSDAPGWTTAYTESPRFGLWEMDAASQHLDRHGFTICKGILSELECQTALDKVWQFFECLGAGIERHQPKTWDTPAANLVFTDAGVIHPHGVIQSEACWTVRGHPHVKRVFASLWGTDELIASFDGLCVYRPWNLQPSWRTRGPWFHTDQPAFSDVAPHESPSGFRREYIQGFVNLIETSPASGGNVIIPGSHLEFEKLAREFLQPGRGQGIPADHEIYRRGIRSHLHAGDLFLWDSRCIHGNGPGDTGPAAQRYCDERVHPEQLLRASVYVCMAPRSRASCETLAQRRRAVANNVGSGAWCAHPMAHGGRYEPPSPDSGEGQLQRLLGPGKYRRAPVAQLSASQLALV